MVCLTMTYAFRSIPPGAIFISRIAGEITDQDLQLEDGKLIAGNKMSVFQYDTNGTLKCLKTGMYLCVDEFGRLSLVGDPHFGFELKTENYPPFQKRLVYIGIEVFELCGDRLIGCRSKCNGSSEITIAYDDLD